MVQRLRKKPERFLFGQYIIYYNTADIQLFQIMVQSTPLSNQWSQCLYGSGADKVATTVNKEGGNFSLEDAQETIEDYFDTFKRLAKWLKNSKEYIKTHGCIYSVFGRKRRLKDVHSQNSQISGHAIRSGINFLVQSVK